jgi:beta-glucuronidase
MGEMGLLQKGSYTMLYPIDSSTRIRKDLNGLWLFMPEKEGANPAWEKSGLPETAGRMPVPASYNELTQDETLRDHIGAVWYERTFYVPAEWSAQTIRLRFGSVTHHAQVWMNGELICKNKGGFLPFEAEINKHLNIGEENRLTVRADNRLDWTCLPCGEIQEFTDETRYPAGYKKQIIHFDFFNYAGIHRPVVLYTVPKKHIEDVTAMTVKANAEKAELNVRVSTAAKQAEVAWELKDASGQIATKGCGANDTQTVFNPKLWQPGEGYLYSLHVYLKDSAGEIVDHYILPVGLRTVSVEGTQFKINGQPFKFKGFGKHEDSILRGRGTDDVVLLKDFELMRWIGANSFRTSHYPYAEEVYRLADEMGIVVIDELPAVGLNTWNPNQAIFSPEKAGSESLAHHIDCAKRMVARDKNHPCVVMWSAGNECATWEEGAVPHFQAVAEALREADPTRPLCIVENDCFGKSLVTHLFDVIGFNRYDTWYADAGCLDLTELHMREHLTRDFSTYGKPVLLAEFGVDTLPGYHADPPVMFTEEYQAQFLETTVRTAEELDFVIGAHVWNFADFATKQGLTRPGGNRKGVFTRDRQPKMAAHTLRKLWTDL